MARGPRLERLTISLLKEGMGRADAVRDTESVDSRVVAAIDPKEPSLFIAARPPHPPRWQAFLAPHVSGTLEGLFAASSAAVLLVAASGRLFAITFGQGRHLLDPDAYEQDFGLKVVLNSVAPDQIKSVDAKTIDETTMHTRLDRSRDSSFSAFGLDVSRDLVRAVTGTPRDETLAGRLTGSDALGINTRAQVPDLPALCERLLKEYESREYKTHFDFIDFLRPEKRADRIHELQDKLVAALVERNIDDVHLAAPEPVDWLEVAGFRFSTQPEGSDPDNDPRISVYLGSRGGDELDLNALKDDRVHALSGDGEISRSWQIYRCIVYQVEIGDELYVLSAGDWFRVSVDFKEQVYAYVQSLQSYEGLPDASHGTREDKYNVEAARAIDGLCLDQKLVFDGGPDRMEVCDVLTRDGGLIHVKHRGSSSTLSHLFAQGVNSAERLLSDPEFRRQARQRASEGDTAFSDVLPVDRPDPEDHEVTFAVITRSARDTPLTLPFFSLVSLRAAARRLQALGFPISVAAVQELQA
jgi:uncharacterized protein (TIGR04141 family)